MIKVTIELISAVDKKHNKILGIAHIALDRESVVRSDGKKGDYSVTLSKWHPKTNEIWKSGEVHGFDRLKRGSWDLLYLALKNILSERN